jgi:hypothetical protein
MPALGGPAGGGGTGRVAFAAFRGDDQAAWRVDGGWGEDPFLVVDDVADTRPAGRPVST